MSESVPKIVIPIDQTVGVEADYARGEVIEAGFVVELTSFERKEDTFVLEGAVLCSGYAQNRSTFEQNDSFELDNIDGDVFSMDAGAEARFTGYAPASARIPFVFEAPVASQDPGLMNVVVRVERGASLVFHDDSQAALSGTLVVEGMRDDGGYRLTLADRIYDGASPEALYADRAEMDATSALSATDAAGDDAALWLDQLQGADRAFEGNIQPEDPSHRQPDYHFEDYASTLGQPGAGLNQAGDLPALESYAETFFGEQEVSHQRLSDSIGDISPDFPIQSVPQADWLSDQDDDSIWVLPELDEEEIDSDEKTIAAEQSSLKVSFHSKPPSEQVVDLKSLQTPSNSEFGLAMDGTSSAASGESERESSSDTARSEQIVTEAPLQHEGQVEEPAIPIEDYASTVGQPAVGLNQAEDLPALESYAETFFGEQEVSHQRSSDSTDDVSPDFPIQSVPQADWLSDQDDDSISVLPELDEEEIDSDEKTIEAEQSSLKVSFHSKPPSEQVVDLKSLLAPSASKFEIAMDGTSSAASGESERESGSDTARSEQIVAEAPLQHEGQVEEPAIPIPLAPVPDVPVMKSSNIETVEAVAPERTAEVPIVSSNTIAAFLQTIYTDSEATKFTMKFRIVQPGETIDRIAEQYRILSSDLMEANRLTSDELDIGAVLYIPPRQPIKIQ